MSRFSYVRYDEKAMAQQQEIKEAVEKVAWLIERLPNTRPQKLALNHLEEVYMWTGKAIRDDQIERTGTIDEQPERNNE